MAPKCAVLAIGDEIVEGRRLNTNTHTISQELQKSGFEVMYHLSIKDDFFSFEQVAHFLQSQKNIAHIFVCGGLGPTTDDKTRDFVEQYFNKKFLVDEGRVALMAEHYPYITKESLKKQSLYIEASYKVSALYGTALAFGLQQKHQLWYFFPGVPTECLGALKEVLDQLVLALASDFQLIETATLNFYWLSERVIDQALMNYRQHLDLSSQKTYSWGLYPHPGGVSVVLKGSLEEIEKIQVFLSTAFAQHLLSWSDENYQEVLKQQHLNIVFEETLTQGLLRWYWHQHFPLSTEYCLFDRIDGAQRGNFLRVQQKSDSQDGLEIWYQQRLLRAYSWPQRGDLKSRQDKMLAITSGALESVLKNFFNLIPIS